MMTDDNFVRSYVPLRSRVLRVCTQLLGGDPEGEDACQEVFLKLWEQRHRLGEVANPQAFIVRVARNYCLDRLRGRQHTLELTEALAAEVEDREEILVREEVYEAIHRWSEALPEPQRTIFEGVHYQARTTHDLATATGLSEGNVRVILSRLRKAIRQQINK